MGLIGKTMGRCRWGRQLRAMESSPTVSKRMHWVDNPASLCSIHEGAAAEGCRGRARPQGILFPEARVCAGMGGSC